MKKALGDSRKDDSWNEILKACVIARIANPLSKNRTASMLEQDYGVRIALEKIYRMMDRDAMDEAGIKYIVASRLKSLSKEMKKLILESEDFAPAVVEDEFHWVKEFDYRQRRLVVSYNSKRAKKDASDRTRLIERLLKKVKDGNVKIKDVIPNYGTKKYLALRDKEAFVDESKIDKDALWDGLHGCC